MTNTVVHVLRHGEVFNPEGVLYGRMPGYHLSELGVRMAERIAGVLENEDIVHVVASPLERAQETARPLAAVKGLDIHTEPRVIESGNWFEGKKFGVGDNALKHPSSWLKLWNPLRPSWGEPYKEVAARMWAAIDDAREAAAGHEAVIVSHQLPIWIARLAAEGRSFVHDPRKRECTLASLTSFHFEEHEDGEHGGEAHAHLVDITYREPAIDLVPVKHRKDVFSAGGSDDEDRPEPSH